MAGRTRRVRVIVLIVFAAIFFLLYTRSSTPVDDFRQYYKNNPIGGGAVIRPEGDKEVENQQGVVGPEPAPASIPPPPGVQSSKIQATSKTTTTQDSSSDSSVAKPTPAPIHHPQVLPDDHNDFPYPADEGRVEVPLEPSPTHTVEHWSRLPEHFPISSTIQLPTGTSIPLPRIQRAVNKLSSNGADKERLAVVKASAENAWAGYKEFAWGMDEVRPVTGRVNNPFNGWGATLVDALDTIWLMGMTTEFEDAVEAVKKIDFTTSPRSDIPVFETTIRYLGGLIAAYDVSEKKYRVLLDKAVELAEVLFSIFDTPNRMPQTFFRWKPSFASQPHRSGNRVILAEIGTLSLEFTRLAQLTGEPKYYDAIARITDEFEKWQNNTRLPGMWPTTLDSSGCGKPVPQPERVPAVDDSGGEIAAGEPVKAGSQKTSKDPSLTHRKRQLTSLSKGGSDMCVPQGLASTSKNSQETFTLSGASDSMYEYLPKEFILLGGQVDQYRTMYLDSAKTFVEKLLYKPMTKDERDILMTGEVKLMPNYSAPIEERGYIETFKPEAAHLACFAGGMFAMGGVLFDQPEHVTIGSKLTDGCVWAYNVTATGIMPEGAELLKCDETWGDCPWDEKKWWAALDPYAEDRLRVNNPGQRHYSGPPAHHAAVDKPAADTAPQASKPEELGGKLDLEKKTEDYSGIQNKHKRQLDPSTAEQGPPRPQPADWGLDDDTPDPDLAESIIEKPLSHEEYVQKKIEEERLPPGYTKMLFRKYILRPEAIESVFYMYRITGDQYWRDVGWNMFTSIERATKAPHGNSAIDDVTRAAPELVDTEESFWLAETLKYFYLLFDEPDRWSLDEWVLNTEAHLFRRPKGEFKETAV